MGNQQNTRRPKQISRYRNNFSLDQSKMKASLKQQPVAPAKRPSNYFEASLLQLPREKSIKDIAPAPPKSSQQPSSRKSSSLVQSRGSVSQKQAQGLNKRLAKLNIKNEELRQQLIKISSQLTNKINRRKYQQLKRDKQEPQQVQAQQGKEKSVAALKKQLQNGYKQVDRYKRLISDLKGNQSLENEQRAHFLQAKVVELDHQIESAQQDIQAAKNIKTNQIKMIKKAQQDYNNSQIKTQEAQIQKLKAAIKVFNEMDKKRAHSQRVAQEYMFQLQRRVRQINGEYLPEIKSYANKNFQPQPKYDKKKKTENTNYKPAKWQMADVLDELNTLKQKHEQYHVKMEKALKSKTVAKQAADSSKQQLENAQKLIETLHYKKDRYLQLVMGNIDFLMNSDDQQQHSQVQGQEGMRIITKGSDMPQQLAFDDHQILKAIPHGNIKIVSINIWYNQKHQICAFQSIYSDGKDCLLGARTSSVNGDMQKQVLEVDEGDFIKNIMGSFSKKGAIEFLAFYSAKGKAKQFGKELMNGLNFTLNVTKRERPICFSGFSFFDGTSWRINKIIVDVTSE